MPSSLPRARPPIPRYRIARHVARQSFALTLRPRSHHPHRRQPGAPPAGVAAVLTWHDIPRVVYSTAGQSDPIPGPLDTFSLDNKVRFVGDRVAFVAAEAPEIAEQALRLIDVDYEVLPALLDSADSMKPSAPRIHDEPNMLISPIQIRRKTWRLPSALISGSG